MINLLIFILILFLLIFFVIKYIIISKKENLQKDNYIFSKIILNDKLYLIFPIYDREIEEKEFNITINNNKVTLINQIKKIENEPIQIFIYKFKNNIEKFQIITGTFEYNQYKENLTIYPIYTNKTNKLGITTLFKDDYEIFPLFYNYYKNQGVSLFIMYYNGISNKKIKEIFNYDDVILIDWNFRYWNPKNIKYRHHAQIGQIHDSIYRFAKPMCEYIIYCDLDEYLHIPKTTLINFIEKNKNLDIIQFNNYFSKTLDNKIPEKNLPKKIKIGKKHNYFTRSKNIYRSEIIESLNIHFPFKLNKTPVISKDHIMFHFQSWTNRNIENLDDIYNIN